MTTIYDSIREIRVDEIPHAEEIEHRFLNSFTSVVHDKKMDAVVSALRKEFGSAPIASSPSMIRRVVNQLDDSAFAEKQFMFIALNPKFAPQVSPE